jgi:hypothetical protein
LFAASSCVTGATLGVCVFFLGLISIPGHSLSSQSMPGQNL